ncbi:uncharacterized protein LOC128953911 [Oppia nitens]|uniref:uncharacterized protein LOC128953911 n=1 Tax=Oppia nitens TaxID=1686743 RepID=UPI0023DC96D5|nr:uncharacterized protein LOC128953911 [Oppia nitens]
MDFVKYMVDPVLTGHNSIYLFSPSFSLDFEIQFIRFVSSSADNTKADDCLDVIPLMYGARNDIIIGQFNDDRDTDFGLCFIKHMDVRDLEMNISYGLNDTRTMYLSPYMGKYGCIRSLDSCGKQFRFFSPNNSQGQTLVRETAKRHSLTIDEAIVRCSSIHLDFRLEFKPIIKSPKPVGSMRPLRQNRGMSSPMADDIALNHRWLFNTPPNVGPYGAVGFGTVTDQIYGRYYKRFVEDPRIEIKPFTIQMAIKP